MRRRLLLLPLLLLLTSPAPGSAELGLILPSDDFVSQGEPAAIALQIRLYDPQKQQFREVAKPQRFAVQLIDEPTDLLAGLKPAAATGSMTWRGEFTVRQPGDHIFHVELPPRWDPQEEQHVVHHAKLCVNAFGREEGWDEPVGLEAEIVPLSRPYGVWTGNLFSGQVLLDGEPAPYAMVEIVWLGRAAETPPAPPALAAPYLVQTVHADAGGVFHYAMPRAGWWGFAATLDADWTISRDGDEKPVAIVTSYWVHARDLQ